MKKLILLLTVAITTQFINAQNSKIHYIDHVRTLNSVSLSGDDHNVILTSFNNPAGISFYNDKLYVSDDNSVNRNYRFNPDGTSGEIMHDEADGATKPSSVAGYNNELYFIDNNFIRKSDINGNNIVDILSLTSTPIGAKLLVVNGKMYWNAGSALRSANIDGTGVTTLTDNGNTFRGFWLEGTDMFYIVDGNIKKITIDNFVETTILSNTSPNLSSPQDLTILDNKLYYTDTGLDKIMRANLDGSNAEEVQGIPGLANPKAITGYNGFIYWSDTISTGKKISRISTSLTGFEVIFNDDFEYIRSLDFSGDKLVFGGDYIKKSNLNGESITTFSASNSFVTDIEVTQNDEMFFLDGNTIFKTSTSAYIPQPILSAQAGTNINSFGIYGDFIYWIENNNNDNSGTIYRSFIDGTNIETIYTSTFILSSINIDFDNSKMYFVRNNFSIVSSDMDGTNQSDLYYASGSVSDFVVDSGTIYFGLTTADFTYALCTVNLLGSNFQLLKELTSSISDIKIYDPATSSPDYNALLALYNSTNGANWTNTWDFNSSISTFYGVTLDVNNRVTSIELNSNNLVGTLPVELGDLTNLNSLFLSGNELTENIPVQLGNLTNLVDLSINYNNLTGTIPVEIANISSLNRLFLNNNNLTGPIPSQLGNLTNLNSLFLSDNQLSGTIPTQLGNISTLDLLYLHNNNLTGTIPAQLGNLTALTDLFLRNNQFTGTIPTELGNLSNLFRLDLSNNQLAGYIPTGLGNLTNLSQFLVNNNQLSGAIPSGLSTINNLTINIENNNFVFIDFEADFPQYQSLTGLTYAPQNNVDVAETLTTDSGGAITLTSRFSNIDGNTPAAANNLYQWYKDADILVDETNPYINIVNATVDDAGLYTLKVTNTVVTGLEIDRNPITLSVNPAVLDPNYMLVTDTSIIKGNTENIDIQLVNSEDIRAFQFDITLPTGFVFNTADLIDTARITDFQTSISDLGNNTFRILGFSFSNAIITAGDTAIVSLPTLVETSVIAGDYTLDITNVILSDINNEDTATNPVLVGTVTVSDFPLGDSNGNSTVDVLDLLQTIDYILGNNPMPFNFTASDVNMDGTINVLDVVGIQDIILNPSNAQAEGDIVVSKNSVMPMENYLLVTDQNIMQDSSTTIEIELENDDPIRAVQFDITLPAGFTLDNNSIAAIGRLNGFIINSADQGGNTYRIIAFDFSGATMASGTDAILSLPVTVDASVAIGDYTLPMTGVLLSDANNVDIASTPLSVGTISVTSTLGVNDNEFSADTLSMYPNPASDFVNLSLNNNYSGDVYFNLYDIAGKLVYANQIEKNVNNLNTKINTSQLSNGVYILNIKSKNNSVNKKLIINK